MTYSWLKRARVVISLIFLVAISTLFLDYKRLVPEVWFSPVLSLQFVPSLLKFIHILSLTAFGFIVVIILTVLFGRVYCSTICPLGILQDVVSWISKKFKSREKRRYGYGKPYTILRYTLLVAVLIVLLLGSSWLILILDPYSNFGRILIYFIKPVLVGLNNLGAPVMEKLKIYAVLVPVDLKPIPVAAYIVPVTVLALVVWMSVTKGRLYCNSVCPVGTFLGFISKFAIFKIRLDTNTCTLCRACEFTCKSSCIDLETFEVDYSRCVACFNCVSSCKFDAAGFQAKPLKVKPVTVESASVDTSQTDTGKRRFIAGTIALLLGSAGLAQNIPVRDTTKPVPKNALPTTIPEDKKFPVSPPGSIGLHSFTLHCTACSLCINACPTDVLQPSFLQFGLTGIMQPYMDYHSGFCNYDCKRCGEVCPTGAILPLILEDKKLAQIGKTHFVKDNCIVKTDKTDCGACSEHCPTKAVHMIPYEGTLVIPEVKEEICIGCGACEHACPTTPFKAIYVDGNEIHKIAEKPKEVKAKNPLEKTGDFPF
ncbi:MAG: 4Fe-4S dicluster domain-containing protein [Chlorobi bacterium]|nr:4Fe-4S dicluster domain-containing protein [Chlorobiota bacterium]